MLSLATGGVSEIGGELRPLKTMDAKASRRCVSLLHGMISSTKEKARKAAPSVSDQPAPHRSMAMDLVSERKKRKEKKRKAALLALTRRKKRVAKPWDGCKHVDQASLPPTPHTK